MKHKFYYHPSYQKARAIIKQLLLPFIIFQFLRTIFLPTGFDVLLLSLFAVLYVCILLDWL
ncbi:hypothetical protein BSNK01_25190 [Bacillaceae bacterium]